MKIGVNVRIDVTKIDKAQLYQGKQGKYLNAVTFIDIDNKGEYGENGFISQDLGKDSDEKGAILGNVTVFWRDEEVDSLANIADGQQSAPAPAQNAADFDDDVPF